VLANQQDVVRNEWRQRIENQPRRVLEEAVGHMTFLRKNRPYYARVLGAHGDIQAFFTTLALR
jgi:hypothetical protein